MSYVEDKILLWRAKHGDSVSLCRIYEKYQRNMVSVAEAMLRDRGAAEDVLHDVFVSFAEHVPELELRTSLRGYLMAAVVNAVRNRFRSKERTQTALGEIDVAASGEGQAAQAEKKDELARLRWAISMLPQEQREVVTLRLQGDMGFSEIAKMTGTNANTARGRYRYGVERLRGLMDSEVTR
jgi:RNA polymerase sigma-70 factor, ECF subfamily